jgi:hypothetical protein
VKSPLEQSYRRPFTHPAFGYTPEPTPAEHWATRQAESRARATERRVDALAIAEAERIVGRQER